ncbi:MAG: cistern family PEP-CTERM protein [Sphingomonadaceae bacterium]
MKSLVTAGFGALAIAVVTAPATATVFFEEGTTVKYAFAGTSGANPLIGAQGFLTLTLTSLVGNTATFSYKLENMSDPMTQPFIRLVAFGFRTEPVFQTASIDVAGFPNVSVPGSFGTLGPRRLCVHAGASCRGTLTDGIASGETVQGKFSIVFASVLDSFHIAAPAIRWQATGLNGKGAGVGVGTVVPEPAMWALLISGFGLVGVTLRRRRADIAAISA